jgi:hypothetical protein
VDIDGEPHIVKFSGVHDNQQFWTVPGERDERLRGRKSITEPEPEPDEGELYDLTLLEERNLAHPTNVDDRSRALQQTMLALLAEQLVAKRLTPSAGETPGYRPPVIGLDSRDRGLPRFSRQPSLPLTPAERASRDRHLTLLLRTSSNRLGRTVQRWRVRLKAAVSTASLRRITPASDERPSSRNPST